VNDTKRDLGRIAVLVFSSWCLGVINNALLGSPIPLWSAEGPGDWRDRSERISPARLQEERAEGRVLLLLDVRSETDFHSGHAPGAILAPASDFVNVYVRLHLGEILVAAQGVVVICASNQCSSGDRVAKILKELGHSNVRVLSGGWHGYRESHMEIVAGE